VAEPVGESIYTVVAYLEGNTEPSSFHINAESPEDAEEKVRLDDAVDEVLTEMTEQFSGVYRLEVSGSPDEITSTLNHIEHVADEVDADVSVDDVTPTIWPAGDDLDDDNAIRVKVDHWADLELRVIGSDVRGENGVLSATAGAMQANEDSTVEVVAGDKVIARAIHEDKSAEPPVVSDGRD